MYKDGDKVSQNDMEAFKWYLVALIVVIFSTLFMIHRCEKIDKQKELPVATQSNSVNF